MCQCTVCREKWKRRANSETLRQQEDIMEVTALCSRLLTCVIILLGAHIQKSSTRNNDAALQMIAERLQLFEYTPFSFLCEGLGSALRGFRNNNELIQGCYIIASSTLNCTIKSAYAPDSGVYWCEDEKGEKSNSVDIKVTAGSVILESPVLPVMEGESVTLSCRNKTTTSSILSADFYKDGRLIRSSSTENMNIRRVSKSDEGLYKCSISEVGESPESWLAVRAGSVILESPLLPVRDGESVTLSCRNQISFLSADFYKDGRLIRSSSTGNITIQRVSKSDEGLYKCSISEGGESPESWLAVRAVHRETCPCSDHSLHVLLVSRTVFTVVMVALLLLLVGLLHSGRLRVTQK
ncbi:low affinity immunoglobulin gamma Fc region receptor II-like isoform X2 [Gymnodraco acuticeps]|uniref:low affinity immunoglobulin gamma Fc region receptor II-like isoform X2 n=1 Tax=Gymnodraco acuticeps TaxID=8218 RepID=UPI001470BCE6|nr:low affinity immunoglobulin gamma Fc region receptor II-like isoform X2 [Gymnodraco acuticeps]